MEELDIPPERQQDPWGRRMPGFGRDGCRTPMQWNGDTQAGFTASAVEPWLPVHPAASQLNVEAELRDPASHLELYRHLLRIRRRSRTLQLGSIEVLESPPGVLSYRRDLRGFESFLIHANLSQHAVSVDGGGSVIVGTDHNRTGSPFDGRLGPWEALVTDPIRRTPKTVP
jgi:alpha-glucosidase